MNLAFEEPGSSVIGLRHGAASVFRMARLFLRGLVLCATACALKADPAPGAKEEGGRSETAASSPEEEVVKLDKVVVTPSQFGIAEERVAPNVTLTNAELETLPQFGEDLYRTISRLPGLTGNDFSAMFLVRGAPNNQLLARFDGVDLIEPFHLKDFDGSL